MCYLENKHYFCATNYICLLYTSTYVNISNVNGQNFECCSGIQPLAQYQFGDRIDVYKRQGYSRTLLHYTDQQRARQAGCDEVITKPYS